MKDYYKILGIARGASEAEIKRAYKQAAMQHHPDRGGDENKFKEINEAYDTLKDPAKKSRYDQSGMNQGPQNPHSGFGGGFGFNNNPFQDGFGFHFRTGGKPFNFEDIIGDFDKRHRQAPVRNRDINVTYTITLNEAFTGKQTTIRTSTPTGEAKTIELNIPAGIENGVKIRYQGEGMHEHKQLPPGDLYVEIRIQHDPRFERTNSDIRSIINVNAFNAMSGTHALFENFDGTTIKVKIPEGTQPGQILRIPGKGMPFWREQRSGRGDLYLAVEIHVPKMSDLHENVVDALKKSRIIVEDIE